MLQQTQVSRAIPRFESFMSHWPTIASLAAATNPEVLAQWSGLGYNTRALRLRDAAMAIAESGWPTTPRDLQKLPGVGTYTANAIASMSFGAHVAATDTNLRRVLSRWFGAALNGVDLVEYADEVVGEPAGTWNQAVMDLGAEICTPKAPSCGRCPVSDSCADPTVYVPPVRQSKFDGSNRQLRGALVRASLAGDNLSDAGRSLGRSDAEIRHTIAALAAEGLVPFD
ncbi:MAG: A/G-specific adenine glycosylase [Actinomycetota bacterium]|nr:A/G-specific adenine glycosylase [Actinomycetota bacterium]